MSVLKVNISQLTEKDTLKKTYIEKQVLLSEI